MMMMMMKYALAFALFQLWCCRCNTVNFNVNKEIIDRLDELSKGNKSTFPNTVRIPSTQMYRNAVSCVNVFVKELRALLQNVTVHNSDEHLLVEVNTTLNLLRPHHRQNDHICRMEQSNTTVRPLMVYKNFLKKINASKKK